MSRRSATRPVETCTWSPVLLLNVLPVIEIVCDALLLASTRIPSLPTVVLVLPYVPSSPPVSVPPVFASHVDAASPLPSGVERDRRSPKSSPLSPRSPIVGHHEFRTEAGQLEPLIPSASALLSPCGSGSTPPPTLLSETPTPDDPDRPAGALEPPSHGPPVPAHVETTALPVSLSDDAVRRAPRGDAHELQVIRVDRRARDVQRPARLRRERVVGDAARSVRVGDRERSGVVRGEPVARAGRAASPPSKRVVPPLF